MSSYNVLKKQDKAEYDGLQQIEKWSFLALVETIRLFLLEREQGMSLKQPVERTQLRTE